MRRLGLLALGALVAGCSIPERTNPVDPANAPTAGVQVLDATGSDGQCGPIIDDTPVVFFAGRGRCLILDARESTDPNGDELYVDYVAISGETEIVLATSTGETLTLSPSQRQSLPLFPEAMRIEVRVRDRVGGPIQARDDTPFQLFNSAPESVVPSRRTLPSGGWPWLPGQAYSVEFDGSSSADPDNDDVEWCWTIDDGVETCGPFASVQTTVPTRDGRTIAELYTRETAASGLPSPRSRTFVTVRPPELWTNPSESFPAASRIDTHRSTIALDFATERLHSMLPLSAEAGIPALVLGVNGLSVPSRVYVHRTHDGERVGTYIASSSDVVLLGVDSVNRRVWTSDGVNSMRTLLVDSTGDITLEQSVGNAGVDATEAALDRDGSIWLAGPAKDGVDYMTPDPGLPFTTLETGLDISGIDARPGTNEVWFTTVDATGSSTIVRAEAGTVLERLDAGAAPIANLAWADGGHFWLFSEADGLLLISAENLLLGESLLQSATVTIAGFWEPRGFPIHQNVEAGVVDRVSGDLLFQSAVSGPVRVDSSGGVRSLGTDLPSLQSAFDSSGATWFATDVVTILRRSSLGSSPAAASVPVLTTAAVTSTTSLDPLTGGIVVASKYPPRLVRRTEVGEVFEVIDTMVVDAVEQPVPLFSRFRMSPDGESAWAVTEPGVLELIEMSVRPPVRRVVLTSSQWLAFGSPSTFEPFAPDGGPRRIWVDLRDFMAEETTFWVLDEDGGMFDAAVVPSTAASAGSRSLTDNSLCGVFENASSEGEPFHVTPDGTFTSLDTHAPVGGESFVVPGASHGTRGGESVCWTLSGFFDFTPGPPRSILQAWSGTSLVHEDTIARDAGAGLNFIAADPENVWFRNLVNGDPVLTRVRFSAAPLGGILEVEDMEDVDGFGWLRR